MSTTIRLRFLPLFFGCVVGLLPPSSLASDECPPAEWELLLPLRVSMTSVDTGAGARADSAAAGSPDTAGLATTRFATACLPEVLERISEGDEDWLAHLAYFEPNSAAALTLQRFLDAKKNEQRQRLLSALIALGPATVDAVLAASDCPLSCDPFETFALAQVLAVLGPERRAAARVLAGRVGRPGVDAESRSGLLEMLLALGADAAPAEPELIALLDALPGHASRTTGVLAKLGTPTALAVIGEQLRSRPFPDRWLIAHLAAAGHSVSTLTPLLVDLSNSEDDYVADAAMIALGHVAAPEDAALARGSLHDALADSRNPRRAQLAAEALGRMRDTASLSTLNDVADGHWYPPVRDAARWASDQVSTQREPVASVGVQEFFNAVSGPFGAPSCERVLLNTVAQPASEKLYASDHGAKLQGLSYPSDLVEEDPPPPPPPPDVAAAETGFAAVETVFQRVPDLALRVSGGWLLGANRGEFGGELVFAGENGRMQGVLSRNIEDIYRLGPHLIALSGLAHLSTNEGEVYLLRQSAMGTWTAEPWVRLPGAPISSWPVDTGEVLVNTYQGGSILIATDGTLRMAPCADQPPFEDADQP